MQKHLKIGLWTTVLLLALLFHINAQNKNAFIQGQITDQNGIPLEGANIWLKDSKGTFSSGTGYYQLSVPANQRLTIYYSYQTRVKKYEISPLQERQRKNLDVILNVTVNIKPVTVEGKKRIIREIVPMQRVDTRVLNVLPTATEKVITIIKTLPGVSSQTELSSSYSVRGGNYDENLVYINGIEIYRPFLIRAGQQEGLPIINSNLVESISFSAGGFEAKYGDKLSSVLDIEYKKPKAFAGSFSASLLGISTHLEGSSKDYRFKYLLGVRQRSNSYLLNSLDVEGEYKTNFLDIQSYLSYDISDKLNVGWFSYYGQNQYNLIPQTRSTDYGTSELALRFTIYFEGQEITSYQNYLNAVDFNYRFNDSFNLRFIVSAYNTTETEYFDVLGQYWLDQIDTDPASETFDSAKVNFGVGSFLNHARNTLNANIFNAELKAEKTFKNSKLLWGVKFQYDDIQDRLREWNLLDSADYIIPLSTGDQLELNEFIKTKINLQSSRISGYIQNSFKVWDSSGSYLTLGVRANHWSYNNEFNVTPRLQFAFDPLRKKHLRYFEKNPNDTTYKTKVQLKAATGLYYQPPFYRELRDLEGNLNPEIRSQKSYHLVMGSDVYFKMWGRIFKWTTEAYFKYLTDIIPYDIEDVRIRYHAENKAVGYATGIDMQIYGEFLKGLPSWANFSLMSTRENLDDDSTFVYEDGERLIDPETGLYQKEARGFIRRPTDQRWHVSIFFQDFLPKNPTYKVNLNFIYGGRVPVSPPKAFDHLRNQFLKPEYFRVDVGFSKLIMSKKQNVGTNIKFLRHFESVWLSAEIFNMFGVRNVISNFWVKDVNNNYWGVPNYLTDRRFNVNLTLNF